MQRNKFAGSATLLLTLTLALAAETPSAAPSGSRWGADYFPNVQLTTQDGKPVRFYDDLLKGKTVAIYLMYTTCKFSCPLETARMSQVYKILGDRVGKDIFFYSITIDPANDTPAVLKEYARQYNAGRGWTFLTGKSEDIELISRKLGLYSPPNPDNPDGHIPRLLVGDEATGQWMHNSALDNPKYLAMVIGDWLNSWKNHKEVKSYADVPALDVSDRGKYVFTNKCSACHTIGEGDRVGPDLAAVASTRSKTWLARFIDQPDKMLAEGDPVAKALFVKYKGLRMPSLGLNKSDVDALIGYLERSQARSRLTTQKGRVAPVSLEN